MVDEIFKTQNLSKRSLNVLQFKSEPNPMLGDDLRVSERGIANWREILDFRVQCS